MEINDIIQLISNNGFAIVMCILLFKKMNTDNEKHKEEVDGLKEVLNELKITMQKILDRLDRSDD